MAVNSLNKNINQAISDLKGIKQAILDKGVEIPTGTPTSEYGNKISKISGGGGLKLPSQAFGAKWSVLAPCMIYQIDVDSSDNVYSVGAMGLIRKQNSDGTILWSQNLSTTVSFQSVTFGQDGYIYVGATDKYVRKFSQDGEQLLSFNTSHTSTIYSILIDSNGNIYTANYDKTIKKFDSSGNLVWTFSDFTQPLYKALIDSEDNVYGIGTGGTLKKINSSGEEVWSFSTGGTCYDMAIDSEDNIYCIPNTVKYLRKINKNGKEIWNTASTSLSGLNQVESITVDSQGYIYFTDTDYNIWKVSQEREIIYKRRIYDNTIKHLRCGNSGQLYCYLSGDKNQYNRVILRLEEAVDVNELLANFGEVSSCEIYENNDSYMLIKAYK